MKKKIISKKFFSRRPISYILHALRPLWAISGAVRTTYSWRSSRRNRRRDRSGSRPRSIPPSSRTLLRNTCISSLGCTGTGTRPLQTQSERSDSQPPSVAAAAQAEEKSQPTPTISTSSTISQTPNTPRLLSARGAYSAPATTSHTGNCPRSCRKSCSLAV